MPAGYCCRKLTSCNTQEVCDSWDAIAKEDVTIIGKLLDILPSVGIFYQNLQSSPESNTNAQESNETETEKSNTARIQPCQDTESDGSEKEAEKPAQIESLAKEDELVSWSVLKHQGDVGMTVTKPQHRRRGLAQITAMTLVEQVLKDGCNCLFEITADNAVTLKMAKDANLKFITTVNIVFYEPHDRN